MTNRCEFCGHAFTSRRSGARFCSSTCRGRAWRLGGVPVPAGPARHDVEDATRAELERAGRLGSVPGQAALLLARQIDDSALLSGASLASVVVEFRRTLANTLSAEEPAPRDPLDVLRDELARKRAQLEVAW